MRKVIFIKEKLIEEILSFTINNEVIIDNCSYFYINSQWYIKRFNLNVLSYTIKYDKIYSISNSVDEYKNKKEILLRLNLLDLQYIFLKIKNSL